MKLKDARDNYYYYTQRTSDIVRQLGFAGIAIIWIFKADIGGKQAIPSELIPATVLIVVGLTLDLFHYIAGALAWGIYNKYREKIGTQEETEFYAPRKINWLTLFFFWTKILTMLFAYFCIFRFLVQHLF